MISIPKFPCKWVDDCEDVEEGCHIDDNHDCYEWSGKRIMPEKTDIISATMLIENLVKYRESLKGDEVLTETERNFVDKFINIIEDSRKRFKYGD